MANHESTSGTAAEYFVAGELLRRGALAFLSIGAHKQIDVLVKAPDGTIRTIDVKAVHGPKPRDGVKSDVSWSMPKVEARGSSQDFFYVLVWLGARRGDYAVPEYFVMAAAWAAEKCRAGHKAWAEERASRDAKSEMRRLHYRDVKEWRDRWDLLGVS